VTEVSTLAGLLFAGGPMMLVLALGAAVLFALTVERMLVLSSRWVIPAVVSEEIRDVLGNPARDLSLLLNLCQKRSASPLAQVVLVLLPLRGSTFADLHLIARGAMDQVFSRLALRNRWFELLGHAGPMAGLIATVTGLIHTFMTLSGEGSTSARLAGGLYVALVPTACSLVLAVAAVALGCWFGNRLELREVELDELVGPLLVRLSRREGE
jgi:biopolymer transport protein ExbB/TolQ